MQAFTVSEAARHCGCPRSTLQRAIRAGRLHLDADHRLAADELTSAGYLHAPGAQQERAAAAQPRASLGEVLRDMQRTMERLTGVIEVLTQELRSMQQERSGSAPPLEARTQQPRRMERPTPPPRPATPARPHGLSSETLQAIADTAAQYDKLSRAELAQLLFDRNIYRARDRQTGDEKPVNRGTLQKWLDQAREAGLL
jgi:transposase-like protein